LIGLIDFKNAPQIRIAKIWIWMFFMVTVSNRYLIKKQISLVLKIISYESNRFENLRDLMA